MSFAFSLPIQPDTIYNFQTIRDYGMFFDHYSLFSQSLQFQNRSTFPNHLILHLFSVFQHGPSYIHSWGLLHALFRRALQGYGALLETSVEGFHSLPDEHIIWLYSAAKFHQSDASQKDITTCHVFTNFRLIFIEKQTLVYSIGYDAIVSSEHSPGRAFTKDSILIGLKGSPAAYNPAYTLNLPQSALTSHEIRITIADKAVLAFFLDFIQLIAQYRFEQLQQRNTQGLDGKNHWYSPPGLMKVCEVPLSIAIYSSHRLLAYDAKATHHDLPPSQTVSYINTKLAQAIHDQFVFLQDQSKLQKALLNHCFLQYSIRLVGNIDQGQVHTGTRQGKHVKWRSKFSESVLLPGLSYPHPIISLIAPQPPIQGSPANSDPWDLPASTRQRSTASSRPSQPATTAVMPSSSSSSTTTTSNTSLSLTAESPIIHFKQPLLFKYTDLHPTATLQFNLQLTISLTTTQAVKSYLQEYQTDPTFNLLGNLSSLASNTNGLLPFELEPCSLCSVCVDVGQTSISFSAFSSIPFLQLSIPVSLNASQSSVDHTLEQAGSMEYPTIQAFINAQHKSLTQSELTPLTAQPATGSITKAGVGETRRRNASVTEKENSKGDDSIDLTQQDVQILLLNTPVLQEFQQDASMFKDTLKSTVRYSIKANSDIAAAPSAMDASDDQMEDAGNPFDTSDNDNDNDDDAMDMIVPQSHLHAASESTQRPLVENNDDTTPGNPFGDNDETESPIVAQPEIQTPPQEEPRSTPTVTTDITVDNILAAEDDKDDKTTDPVPVNSTTTESRQEPDPPQQHHKDDGDGKAGNPFDDIEDPKPSPHTETRKVDPEPIQPQMLPIPLAPPLKTKDQPHQDQPIVKMSSRITKKFTRHTDTAATSTSTPIDSPMMTSTSAVVSAVNDLTPHQQTLTVRSVFNGVETLITQQETMVQMQAQAQAGGDIGRNRAGSITDSKPSPSADPGAGIMQYDDFIWEYQRYDKTSNTWTKPYLPRDPYPFSDSKGGETYKTLDSVALKPWWKWYNQWSVVVDAELMQSFQEEQKLFKNEPGLLQQATLTGLSQLVLGNQTPRSTVSSAASTPVFASSNSNNLTDFSLDDPKSRKDSKNSNKEVKDEKDITTTSKGKEKSKGIFGKLKSQRNLNKDTTDTSSNHSPIKDESNKSGKLEPESTPTLISATPSPFLSPRQAILQSTHISQTFSTYLQSQTNTHYTLTSEPPTTSSAADTNKSKPPHAESPVEELQALLNRTLPQSHFAANLLLLALPHRNVPFFSLQQFIKDTSEANIFRKAFVGRHSADSDSKSESNRDSQWLELCKVLQLSLENTQINRLQQRGEYYTLKGHICDMAWEYAPHHDDKLSADVKSKDKEETYKMDVLKWSNVWSPGCNLRRRCWVRTRVYAGPHYPTCPCEFCFSMESCFQQDTMMAPHTKSPLMNFVTGDPDLDMTLKLYTPNIQKIQTTLLSMNISAIISEIYAQMTRYDKDHSNILIKQPQQLQIPSNLTAQTIPLLVGINWVDIARKMKVVETILTHDRRYSTQVLPALQQFVEQGGVVTSTAVVTGTAQGASGEQFTARRPSRVSLYQRPQGFRGNKKMGDVDENDLYYTQWISPSLWAQYHNLLSILLPSATLALTQYLPFIDVKYIEKCITSEVNPKNLLNYVIDFTELKQATDLVIADIADDDDDDDDDDNDNNNLTSSNPFDSDDDKPKSIKVKGGRRMKKSANEDVLSLDDFNGDQDANAAGNPFADDSDNNDDNDVETVVNFNDFSKLSKTERLQQQRLKQQEVLASLREFNKHLQAASIAHQNAKELCILLETYAKRAKVIQRDMQRVNAMQTRRSGRSSSLSSPVMDSSTTTQTDDASYTSEQPAVSNTASQHHTQSSTKPFPPNVLSVLCPYQTAAQQYHLPPKTSVELQTLGLPSDTSVPSPHYLISQIMLIFASAICSGFDLAFNPTSPPIYSLPIVSIHGKPIIPPGYSVFSPADLKTMESQLEKKQRHQDEQGSKFSPSGGEKIATIQPQPLGLYTACNCANAGCIEAKIRGHLHFYHQLHANSSPTLPTYPHQAQAVPPTPQSFLQRATKTAIGGVNATDPTSATSQPLLAPSTALTATHPDCVDCLRIAPQYKTQDSTSINAMLQLWPRRLAYIARFLQLISFIEQTGVIPRSWNLSTTVLKTINYINTYHFTTLCVLSGTPEPLYIFQPTHALNVSTMYRNFLQIQPQCLNSLPVANTSSQVDPALAQLVPQQDPEPNYIFPGSINHNIAGALFQHPLTQFACKQQVTSATIFQHTYTPKQLFALYKQLTDAHYFTTPPGAQPIQLPVIAPGQSPQQTSLHILKFLATHIDLHTPTSKYMQQFKQPLNFYFFTQTLLHTIETHHTFSKKHKTMDMMKTYILNAGGNLGAGPSQAQVTALLNEMLSLSFLEATYLRANSFLQTLPSILHHPIPIRLDYPFHHYFYLIRKELVSTMMSNIKTFISGEIFIANPIVLHPPQITSFIATSNNITDLLYERGVHIIPDETLIELHYKANSLQQPSTLSSLLSPFSSSSPPQVNQSPTDTAKYQQELEETIIKYNNPTSYPYFIPPVISSQFQPSPRTPYFHHPLVSLLPPTPFDPHEVINTNSCLSNTTTATPVSKPASSTTTASVPAPTSWAPLSTQNLLYPVLKSTSSNVLQQLGLISEEQCMLIIDPDSPKLKQSISQAGQDISTQRDSVIRTIQELLLSQTNINTMPKEISGFLPHLSSSTIQSISPLQSVESIFIYAKKQYKKISLLLQHNPILLGIICNDLLTCFDIYYCYLFHLLASPHAQPTPLPTISRMVAIAQQPQSILYNTTLSSPPPSLNNAPVQPTPQQHPSSGGFFSSLLSGAIDVALSKQSPVASNPNQTPTSTRSSRKWFDYLQNKSRNLTQSLLTIIGDKDIVSQLNQPSVAPGQPIPHNLELSGFSPWWLQFSPHPSNSSGSGVPLGPLRLQEYQLPTIYPKFKHNNPQDSDAMFDLHFNPLQHQTQVENDQCKSVLYPLSPSFNLYHYTLGMVGTLSSITPYSTQLSLALNTLSKTGLVQNNSSAALAHKLPSNRNTFDAIDEDSAFKTDHELGTRGVLIYDTIPFETSLSITLTIDRFIQSIESLIQYIAGSLDPLDQLLLEYRHLIPRKDLQYHNFDDLDESSLSHAPKPLEHAVQMLSSFNFAVGPPSDEKYLAFLQDLLGDSVQHISDVKKYSIQMYFALTNNMYKLRKSAITQALAVLVPSLVISLGNVSTLMKDLNSSCLGHQSVFYDHLASQLHHCSKYVGEVLVVNTNNATPLLFTPRFFNSRPAPPQYTQAVTSYESSTFSCDFVMKYYHFHSQQAQLKSSSDRNTPKQGPKSTPIVSKPQPAPLNNTASDMTSQMTRMSATTGETEVSVQASKHREGTSTNPFDDQSDEDDQLFSNYLQHQAEANQDNGEEETFDSIFDSQMSDESSMTSRIFGNQTKSRLDTATQKQQQLREQTRERRNEQRARQDTLVPSSGIQRKGSMVGAADFFDEDSAARSPQSSSVQELGSGNPFEDDDDNIQGTRSRQSSAAAMTPEILEETRIEDDDLDDPLLAYYASFGADDFGEGECEFEDDDNYEPEFDALREGDQDLKQANNPFDDDDDDADNSTDKTPLDLKLVGDDEDDEQLDPTSTSPTRDAPTEDKPSDLTASSIIDSIVDSDNDDNDVKDIPTDLASPSPHDSKLLFTATTECGLPFEISYVLDQMDSSNTSMQYPVHYDLAHHAVLPSEFIKHFIAALLGLDTSTILSIANHSSNSVRQEIKPAPTTSVLTVLSLLADKPAVFNSTLKNIFSSLLLPLLIGSYGEYIPFNLKSIPLPPPPLSSQGADQNSQTNQTDHSSLIDTQYLCNHIPQQLRNPQLLTLPLQQIIADFSATHTLIPVLCTLNLSSLSPFFFTTALNQHQVSTGSTLVSTTTKYDIVDYHTTLQHAIGIDSTTSQVNTLKLSHKEKQSLKSQDRCKRDWKKQIRSQEFLPRLGGWIGYCAGFIELLNKLQIDLTLFLPSQPEMDLLLSLPLQHNSVSVTTGPSSLSQATRIDRDTNTLRDANIALLSSKLQLRLDLFDQLKMHTPSQDSSNPPPPLQPQLISTITQHVRAHLLFLFYTLRLGKITPNSLQWCTILMNYTTSTAYLLANLYIQHAPYDATPVWVKF